MRFRHLALAEIKRAAPVRRPAAVIISDDGLGLAITKSDAIAPHGPLLPKHDYELAATKCALLSRAGAPLRRRKWLCSPLKIASSPGSTGRVALGDAPEMAHPFLYA